MSVLNSIGNIPSGGLLNQIGDLVKDIREALTAGTVKINKG